MSSDRLNLGLIGTGRIGRLHAEHLSFRLPQANLVMVSDIAEKTAQQCAEHCQIEQVTTDYRDILNNPDIQAVVICSSTDTHAQIIEEAAAAGTAALFRPFSSRATTRYLGFPRLPQSRYGRDHASRPRVPSCR